MASKNDTFDQSRRSILINGSVAILLLRELEKIYADKFGSSVPAITERFNKLRSVLVDTTTATKDLCDLIEDYTTWETRDDEWEKESGSINAQAFERHQALTNAISCVETAETSQRDGSSNDTTDEDSGSYDNTAADNTLGLASQSEYASVSPNTTLVDSSNASHSASTLGPPLESISIGSNTDGTTNQVANETYPALESTVELNRKFLQMLDSPDTYIHEDPERPCYFTLGQCDVYSVIINVTTNRRIKDFEHAANLLWKILRSRMRLIEEATQVATNAAIDRVLKKCVHTDVDAALSKGLWDFDSNLSEADIVNTDDSDTILAAQTATDRCEKGSKWSTHALFSRPITTLLAKVKNYHCISRVMTSVSFGFLLGTTRGRRNKRNEQILERFRSVCKTKFRKEIDDLSLAEIHDEYLVQMVKSSDESVKSIARDVCDVFMKELATNKKLIPIYLQGESVPPTVDFQSLSKEEIEAYVTKNTKPYMCEKSEDEKYECSQKRRRIASRLTFYYLLSKLVGNVLCEHKLMNADRAKDLSYGLVCLSASHFVKDEFSFFFDAQLHTGLRDKQHMVDLINGPIAKIFKNMSNAATTFREDRMFVNITNDTKEGSREAEQLFAEYFSYQNDGG